METSEPGAAADKSSRGRSLELAGYVERLTGESFADFSFSPGEEFAAAARDGYWEGEQWIQGKLLLMDTAAKAPLWEKAVDRPRHPKVSDIGSVLVEDLQPRQDSKNSLKLFDLQGNMLWEKEFGARIKNSGISPSGERAFAATLSSKYEPHSSRLFFFDASRGTELWSRDLHYSQEEAPYECDFDGDQLVAVVRFYEEEQRFHFGETGELPNEYLYFSYEINIRQSGLATEILPQVKIMLIKSWPEIDKAEELLGRINIEELPLETKAKALRYHGEIQEARGNLRRAAEAWEQALEQDPDVGIRERYQALQKKLHTGK
ncbi:hypothetical protein [Desulfonatronospira sp.]|uniref:hypothetical protein n=1 Tax=Desulfonatronospira sp. TaxID=1962951 RepID=UPI0025BB0E3D|nr:hypothetical protein [Desulfonatronospira sp.]